MLPDINNWQDIGAIATTATVVVGALVKVYPIARKKIAESKKVKTTDITSSDVTTSLHINKVQPKEKIDSNDLTYSVKDPVAVQKKNNWICDQLILNPLNRQIKEKYGEKIVLPKSHWNYSKEGYDLDGFLSYEWPLVLNTNNSNNNKTHCSFDICVHRKSDEQISVNFELRRRSYEVSIIEKFNSFSPSTISTLKDFHCEKRKDNKDKNIFLFSFKDVVIYSSFIESNDKKLTEEISRIFIPALDDILKVLPPVN